MIEWIILAPVTVLSSAIAALVQPTPWTATAGRMPQPIGHYEICQRSPVECGERRALAACATQTSSRQAKEYFPESKYGKASPRVASLKSPKPRGGGHFHIGQPYKVAGVWYHPKLDPDYSRVGRASWYGAAFDGRLTANGEVYDMHALTAASPTLPLPSYARVTNLKNGSSVIVRVNDRGPFAKGRIIDLSACAAKMLAYGGRGVAKVKVDYVGPAPLHGNDQRFLMASYKPPREESIDKAASGEMLAMNGSTATDGGHKVAPPSDQLTSVVPIPRPGTTARAKTAALAQVAEKSVRIIGAGDPTLPAVGPLVLYRPGDLRLAANRGDVDLARGGSIPRLVRSYASYADQRVASTNVAEGAMGSLPSSSAL